MGTYTCFKTYQMHPRLQRIFFSPLSNSLGAGVLGSLFNFCGVPEKALIQPFSLSDSILTLNFELVRKTDVANWKTSLESHHFGVLQTLNLSQFLCGQNIVAAFCPLASSVYFYRKKNSSLRSFGKEHTDNMAKRQNLQASSKLLVTCQLTERSLYKLCITNLLIYFTRRGLARMCFCFTVIATLVS